MVVLPPEHLRVEVKGFHVTGPGPMKRLEPEIQYKVLDVMEGLETVVPVRKMVFALLEGSMEDIRSRAMKLLLTTNDVKLFPTLVGMLEKRASMSLDESIAI